MIKSDNVKRNLCVICDKFIELGSYWQCKNCNRVCQTVITNFNDELKEIKSACCNADVNNKQKLTCSEKCHDKFVEEMLKEFGEFKKISDSSGNSYKVPTKIIIEKGITSEELKDFPLWE